MKKRRKRFFQIKWKKSAVKKLKKIPKKERIKILEKIEKLSVEPFSGIKLKGTDMDIRKLRVGEYRIIYLVDENNLFVLIVKVGVRGDIYKGI